MKDNYYKKGRDKRTYTRPRIDDLVSLVISTNFYKNH